MGVRAGAGSVVRAGSICFAGGPEKGMLRSGTVSDRGIFGLARSWGVRGLGAVRPSHQRGFAFGLAGSTMAAVLALLPLAFAAEPDGLTAAAAGRPATDRSGYLTLARAPGLRGFAPAGEPFELCADDREASGNDLRRVR